MKNIAKDIKNDEIKRVYLIYGEEKYLVSATKRNLLEAIVAPGDNMNFTRYSDNECVSSKIIEMAETLPFLARYRVLLIEDSGWFKSANEEMAEYISRIPEDTVLLFVESEVDKRNKLYKQVAAKGYVCQCERQSRSELSNWILRRLTREEKKITKDNMNYLLDKLGDDMENISKEIDKLVTYTLGREIIEKKDIDAVCISEITGKIFEMIDCIGNKNQKKALDLYYDLIAVREAPMKILFMLSRQFNIMYQTKEMLEKGLPNAEIAKRMGMQAFIIGKTAKQCKNFSLRTLKNAMEYCLKLEEMVKMGNMNDKMAVELIIVKYSE